MKLALTYFLVIASLLSFAQSPISINYNTEDGLPSNECYDIVQDGEGFIWIGTDRGLIRFDGTNFKHFTIKEGLAGHSITNLYLDREKQVWCIVLGSGVSHATGSTVMTPSWSDDLKPVADKTSYIHQGSDGEIRISLMATKNLGAMYASIDTADSFAMIQAPEDREKYRFIAYERDATGDFFTFSKYPTTDTIKIMDLKGESRLVDFGTSVRVFRKVIFTQEGDIIVTGGSEIFRVDESEEAYRTSIPKNITNALYQDRFGDIWVGTFEGGVYRFRNGDLDSKPEVLFEGTTITGLCEDDEGGLWFTSIEEGVFYIPFRNLRVFDYSSGLPEKRITRSVVSGDSIYLMFRNGHVVAADLSLAQPNLQEIGDYRYVYDAFVDRNNKVNVAVDVNNSVNSSFVEWPPASCLFPDNNLLYLATTSGPILIYELDDLQKSPIDTIGTRDLPRIYNIVKSEDGTLYFGSKTGLYTYSGSEVKFLGEEKEEFQKQISASARYEDKIFLAIAGFGIVVLDEDKERWLNTGNVLSNDFITSIVASKDRIWLCSTSGIDMLEMNTLDLENPEAIHIGPELGLPSASVNDVELLDSNLWVMTDNGVAILPLSLIKPVESPNIYLSSFQINGVESDPNIIHELDPFENNIEIGFEAIAFRNAAGQRFYYKFGNENAAWQSTVSNRLNFSNLSPGKYDLWIGTNTEATESLKHVQFKILTPVWQRWWVILLTIAFLAIITSVIITLRFRSFRQQADYEQKISSLSYKALRTQMNPHFIYNALNAIQNFIINKDQKASIEYLGNFSKLIRSIFENSSKDFVPLDTEIETLNLYVELEKARYPNLISFSVDMEGVNSKTRIPPMILQPFIENAILHGILPSNKEGSIALKAKGRPGYVEFSIEDNGIGIDKGRLIGEKKRRYLNKTGSARTQSGMSVTKERIESLAKNSDIDPAFSAVDLSKIDNDSSGTRVKFNLPAQ